MNTKLYIKNCIYIYYGYIFYGFYRQREKVKSREKNL